MRKSEIPYLPAGALPWVGRNLVRGVPAEYVALATFHSSGIWVDAEIKREIETRILMDGNTITFNDIVLNVPRTTLVLELILDDPA